MRSRSSCADRVHQGRAFDEFVARGGEDASLGNGSAPVSRTAHALQCHGDRSRRTDLADQIDGADVDAEFERSRRHQQAHLAVLQLAFGLQAQLARKAAVMRRHLVFAQSLVQDDAPRARPSDAC